MSAAKPRIHPTGGWYCEVGTAGRGPACDRKAAWVLADCAHDPGRYPGAVICTKCVNERQRCIGGGRYVPLEPLTVAGSRDGR
jgi:hypothetical protein